MSRVWNCLSTLCGGVGMSLVLMAGLMLAVPAPVWAGGDDEDCLGHGTCTQGCTLAAGRCIDQSPANPECMTITECALCECLECSDDDFIDSCVC